MTLFDKLQSHRGGLLRLKTELYWYYGRGYDDNPGRICLVLDAKADAAARASTTRSRPADAYAAVLLLIDGSPQWIWVAESDVEVI